MGDKMADRMAAETADWKVDKMAAEMAAGTAD